MKKVIISTILLIAISSTLLAKEIDRERIMPKKLIYSELPDDYPKELNELFEFYYVEALRNFKEYEKNRGSRQGIHSKLISRIADMDEEKKFRILYLDWLAKNTIPLYYGEFNGLHFRSAFINSIPEDKFNKISYMPKELVELKKSNKDIPWVNKIKGSVKSCILKTYPDQDLEFLLYKSHFFWVKAEVLESEIFERKLSRRGAHKLHNYVRLKILDTIGGKFKQEEITLRIYTFGSEMKKNEVWLIPISCYYYNYQFEDTISFAGKLIGNEPVNYGTGFGACYKIEDGKIQKKRMPITAHPSEHIEYPFLPEETELTYSTFKERVEKLIDFIKQKAGN